MTLKELILRTRELLLEGNEEQVADAKIVRLLNRAYEQVAQRTYCLRDYWIAPVVGTNKVALPPYLLAIYTAIYQSDGSTSVVLEPMYWSAFEAIFGPSILDPPTGTPTFLVCFSPQTVLLYPAPSSGGMVKGLGAMLPHPQGTFKPLTLDDDEPAFVPSEHDILAYWAAAELMAGNPAFVRQAQQYMAIVYERMNAIKNSLDDLPMRPLTLQSFGTPGKMNWLMGILGG